MFAFLKNRVKCDRLFQLFLPLALLFAASAGYPAKKPESTGRESLNRVDALPGEYFYALRLDVPGYRAVHRRKLAVRPFSGAGLELSGVILGSPAGPDQPVPLSRHEVDILPRPSLVFRQAEIITVYFELYGLQGDPEGSFSFSERVTVAWVKEFAGEKAGLIDGMKRLVAGKKRSTSLTLSFDRNTGKKSGPAPEHFTIDTSELIPGVYRLIIEVQDKATGQVKMTAIHFNLAG